MIAADTVFTSAFFLFLVVMIGAGVLDRFRHPERFRVSYGTRGSYVRHVNHFDDLLGIMLWTGFVILWVVMTAAAGLYFGWFV